jgi:hypothetical protein
MEQVQDGYKVSKSLGSLLTHAVIIGGAYAVAPSIAPALPIPAAALWASAFAGRYSHKVTRTGMDMEAGYVAMLMSDTKDFAKPTVMGGLAMGIWQPISRPVAYGAIALGIGADLIGYAVKCAASAALMVTRESRKSIPILWEGRPVFSFMNSARDVFAHIGSISPSYEAYHGGSRTRGGIYDNSLFELSATRREYMDKGRYLRRVPARELG